MKTALIKAMGCAGLVSLLALNLVGCVSTPSPAERPTAPLEFDARVVHVPLEGGFYGLLATDDTRYEPLDLASRFQRDGLRLHVQAEPADVASIRMWGRPIRVLHAEPLQ